MPIKLSGLIGSLSGKAGNVVFSTKSSSSQCRQHKIVDHTPTLNQVNRRQAYKAAVKAWNGLNLVERAELIAAAKDKLTAFNIYVSNYLIANAPVVIYTRFLTYSYADIVAKAYKLWVLPEDANHYIVPISAFISQSNLVPALDFVAGGFSFLTPSEGAGEHLGTSFDPIPIVTSGALFKFGGSPIDWYLPGHGSDNGWYAQIFYDSFSGQGHFNFEFKYSIYPNP